MNVINANSQRLVEEGLLKEIKAGETGRGILKECDGYISLDCGSNRMIKEGIDSGSMVCPSPLIVDAVFQKFGIKNANGRIYPENILRREVEKYQQMIRDRAALGECYTPSAMVLSKDGWKIISHIKEGDEIVTLNTENGCVEFQKVTRTVNYEYTGQIVRITGDEIDDSVTPGHRYPIYDENGDYYGYRTADELFNHNVENQKDKFIPKLVEEDEDEILLAMSGNNGKAEDADMSFISLDRNHAEIYGEYYKGLVYCLEVPNHVFYVRQGNKSHWTGNCNHPSETTIDLGRISHNITELHWEGSTLVGKLMINVTPGYCKFGICSSFGDTIANLILSGFHIGVSSRGVGSVEKKYGEMVVGDDFEILCWDVVATPSTPGAYIGSSKDEISMYIESEKKDGSLVTEKLSRLKNLI